MPDRPTIKAYDMFANAYDLGVVDFWKHFPKEFIRKFTDSLPGKRVLNLGSGSGRDAVLLREAGLDVICVDASQSMIDITTNLGFESYLSTFSHMPFPNNSFDGIWAHGSLLHVRKKEAAIIVQHLHALLKPQGLCAVGVIEGLAEGMVEHAIMPDAPRYFKFYQNDELKDLFDSSGFTFAYEQQYPYEDSIFLNHLYRIGT